MRDLPNPYELAPGKSVIGALHRGEVRVALNNPVDDAILRGTASPTIDYALEKGGWVLERLLEDMPNTEPLLRRLESASHEEVEVFRVATSQLVSWLERVPIKAEDARASVDALRTFSEKTFGKLSSWQLGIIMAIFYTAITRLGFDGMMEPEDANSRALMLGSLGGLFVALVHNHVAKARANGGRDLSHVPLVNQRLKRLRNVLSQLERIKRT